MHVRPLAILMLIMPTLVVADIKVTRDIVYGQGATESGPIDLELDLYTPSEGCQRGCPTVIGMHGGGFLLGSQNTQIYATFPGMTTGRTPENDILCPGPVTLAMIEQ